MDQYDIADAEYERGWDAGEAEATNRLVEERNKYRHRAERAEALIAAVQLVGLVPSDRTWAEAGEMADVAAQEVREESG